MNTVGKNLLGCLVHSGNMEEFLRLDLRPEFFVGVEADVFDYINEHVRKFGKLPQPKTIEQEVGEYLPSPPEPPKYYLEKLESRYVHQRLKESMLEAQDYLKAKSPFEALEKLGATALELMMKRKRKQIVNFASDGAEMIKEEYKKKLLMGDEYGIMTGWPTLDAMISGLLGGDVLAIVGRPASGKTYMTLSLAHHAWWVQKKVPLVISMEMKPLPLVQRIAAIHTHKPVHLIKNAEMSTKSYNDMMGQLQAVSHEDRPYWIVDGNLTSTVKDIIMLARQLQPDVVYIDGAYLVRHWNPKTPRWEKVADNTEMIKEQLAGDLDIPVVASYQFNRTAANKKSVEDGAGLEHIAGADVIGQIASIVLGLFQAEDVETMVNRRIDILKGRNGEIGGFNINWNFDRYPYMDFSEIDPEKEEDKQLDYV